MKNEKKADIIKKKLEISGENKEIKLSYLNKILSEIDKKGTTQKCILENNSKENYLKIENTANSLEELLKEYKKIGKSLNENQLLYIIYRFVELGAILDDNFCYNQEICVNSIKIYLDDFSKFKIKLLNPFFNDKFRKEFISDFLEIFPNIPGNKTFEFNLFKSLERKKYLKCDKDDDVLKTLFKLDQYIYIKSKNCFYQLFFMAMCLAAGVDENEFKLEEKHFYEKIKETIENLNIKKENKDFFRFVLVRKNFDNLISFAEIKNYLDIELVNNYEGLENDQFFNKFNLFFKNLNDSRGLNEFENDLKIIKNIFPNFQQKNEARKVLRISLEKNRKSTSINSKNKNNEYNFYNPEENENNGYTEIKTKIDNLASKIKKYRESIQSSSNFDENFEGKNYENKNFEEVFEEGKSYYNNTSNKIIRKSAVYRDVNLTTNFQKIEDNYLTKNNYSKNNSISSSKKVTYIKLNNNKENKTRILRRSNISNISKRSYSQNRENSQICNSQQGRVVSSRVIYVKTDNRNLRSNKKSKKDYLIKRSYYNEERVTPSLTPVKNLRRSYSQNNYRESLKNKLNKKENFLNLVKESKNNQGFSSSRYEVNNKENYFPDRKKKMNYNKMNSSMRSFKNINISNFSKNEFNYSKLYEKLCPKKRNKSLDGSCFSFNNSFLNLQRSSYLKKGSTRNIYKNLNYKDKMNEYNF